MYECDLGEIILQIILEVDENILSLHRKIATGSVGRAVRQRSANRVQQFKSATDLRKSATYKVADFVYGVFLTK